MPSGYSWVYLTAPSQKVALGLGRMAVDRRLAACAHVGPAVTAVYRWAGTACEEQEVRLVLKTRASQTAALVEALAAAHPYECPGIVCLPVAGGHEPFLQWIEQETQPDLEPA